MSKAPVAVGGQLREQVLTRNDETNCPRSLRKTWCGRRSLTYSVVVRHAHWGPGSREIGTDVVCFPVLAVVVGTDVVCFPVLAVVVGTDVVRFPVLAVVVGTDVVCFPVLAVVVGTDVVRFPVLAVVVGTDVVCFPVLAVVVGTDVVCFPVLAVVVGTGVVGFVEASPKKFQTKGKTSLLGHSRCDNSGSIFCKRAHLANMHKSMFVRPHSCTKHAIVSVVYGGGGGVAPDPNLNG